MLTKRHAEKRTCTTRFLRIGDIPSLLDLECRQWTPEQSATAEEFRARLDAYPDLCIGAFCNRTGELLASVFCKPTTEAEWSCPRDWSQSAKLPSGEQRASSTRCLFGISLTSVDPDAALQLLAFYFLYGIRIGVRKVFLGSPMPGLKRYLERHPATSVEQYARMTRAGLPLDHQLRYYHGKGWHQLVAVRQDYFPHEASLNHAAILRADVALTWMRPLFRCLPVWALAALASLAPRFAIPDAKHGSQPLEIQA